MRANGAHGRRFRDGQSGNPKRHNDLAPTLPLSSMKFRTSLAATAVLGAFAGLAQGASAAILPAQAMISSVPSLSPTFNPAITDYSVTCPDGSVTISATAGKSVTVALDGNVAKTGAQAVTAHMIPGNGVRWTVTTTVKARKKSVMYRARCVPADMAMPTFTRTGTPTADLYLFNPSGGAGGRTGMNFYSMLIDTRGVPLWWRPSPIFQLNGTVLNNNGFATYVPTSLNRLGDFGFGRWAIVDWAGKVTGRITTQGTGFDPHEFFKTKAGGYMTLTFEPVQPTDLSSIEVDGPTDAVGYRGYLREVSADGRILWSWHASTHISVSELSDWARQMVASRTASPVLVDGHPAFDIDHISSIDETPDGIMIASRHLDAIYMIDKATGAIRWKLGGSATAQSLAVSGDTVGPDTLAAPHDARMLPDGTVSVMDVGLGHGRNPRMVRFSIDPISRRATVVQQITEESASSSNCCGTVKRLRSRNWVISWGSSGIATETNPLGVPQLRMELPDKRFSYRVTPIELGAINHASLRTGMDAAFPRAEGS